MHLSSILSEPFTKLSTAGHSVWLGKWSNTMFASAVGVELTIDGFPYGWRCRKWPNLAQSLFSVLARKDVQPGANAWKPTCRVRHCVSVTANVTERDVYMELKCFLVIIVSFNAKRLLVSLPCYWMSEPLLFALTILLIVNRLTFLLLNQQIDWPRAVIAQSLTRVPWRSQSISITLCIGLMHVWKTQVNIASLTWL